MAVEIIAEVAQGYQGDPKLAHLLTDAAITASADSVKFQLVIADELCIADYPYYGLFKSLEMPDGIWEELVKKTSNAGKKFYCDIYGPESLRLAKKLGVSGIKISTTDFYNGPLIKEAIGTFPKVFLSIGGVAIEEIDETVRMIKNSPHVTLMYGFQAEPTTIEHNHLLRLRELKKRHPAISFGFMDHSAGESPEAILLPILALGFSMDVLEKHITLERALQLEDHLSALEPQPFRECVQAIRTMEKAMGAPDLVLTQKEIEYKNRAGKVIVGRKELGAGDVITEDAITLKRISVDGSPDCFRKSVDVIGKILKKPLAIDCPITRDGI